MSGGEQQMLALARAMMARPRLLLLDEPSLGLAPLVTRELFAQLGDLNQRGGTVHPRRRAERQPGPGHRPLGLRAGGRAHRRAGPGRAAPRRRGRPQGLPGVLRCDMLFVEQVLNGVGNGVVYGSVALALVLIFRTTGVLNFAQGEMALFSTFIAWKLTSRACRSCGAIAISMAIAFFAGAVDRARADPPGRGLPQPAQRGHRHAGPVPGAQLAGPAHLRHRPAVDAVAVPRGRHRPVQQRGRTATSGRARSGLVPCCSPSAWCCGAAQPHPARAQAAGGGRQPRLRPAARHQGRVACSCWAGRCRPPSAALAGSLVAAERTGFDASLMQTILVYALAAAALGGFDSLIGAVVARAHRGRGRRR